MTARKSNLQQVPYGTRKHCPGPLLPYSEWPERLEMLDYVAYHDQRGVDWYPNEPFEATLRFDGFERGRSAAKAWWVSENTGTYYPMFLMDLDTLLRSGTIVDGRITGRFMARKQGANYGLLRVTDETPLSQV